MKHGGMFAMNYADLHIHSLYSDGSFSPEEIIARANAHVR